MDFLTIRERIVKKGGVTNVEIFPDFRVKKSQDLMTRGKDFYAIWDEDSHLWSTDPFDVSRIIDNELERYYEKRRDHTDDNIYVRYCSSFDSSVWTIFTQYVHNLPDNYRPLDLKVTFKSEEVSKQDYRSRRLPYDISPGEPVAYNELMNVLYAPDQLEKIEWAVGALLTGEYRDIQKFIVLYGERGTGKSTVLNIIQDLFNGYYTTFDAKALASSANSFATEVFKGDPIVAIQHDGDLSRIDDNTKLNSIVSHEAMTVNEKYKSQYTTIIYAMLFVGTNKPVKITDGKSGLLRRLIDVEPTGQKVPHDKYNKLILSIKSSELGKIANKCINVFNELGPNYYDKYVPLNMQFSTDTFFNFVDAFYDEFEKEDGVSLNRAYDMYKQYCEESELDFKMPKYKFREELKNYFNEFGRKRVDGQQFRSYYSGFITDKFSSATFKDNHEYGYSYDTGILDDLLADCPAQYSKNGKPVSKWENCNTVLKDINTKEEHFVKPPGNMIVVDFDIRGEDGEKDSVSNLKAAEKFPETYGEYSKSGNGVHLHYYYSGDISELQSVYSSNIEIKVFTGNASLRRKATYSNGKRVATIQEGYLPTKKRGKQMIDKNVVKDENHLRNLILKGLKKEVHSYTKPSMCYIQKITEDAYNSGMEYDVSDMSNDILIFAAGSSNQAKECIKIANSLHLKSEDKEKKPIESSGALTFFDVEVFPNLFLVCYKEQGSDEIVSLFNPSSSDIEVLLNNRLVGFNNLRYDNHIMYARYIGYDNYNIWQLSQRIVSGDRSAMFREAYNLSYTDVYDFSSKKQRLKKWEIELGIDHDELDWDWNEPIPEDLWERVAEYCKHDVAATEKVFEACHADWTARQILASLSGLTVNQSTNQQTQHIIFGDNRHPQNEFVYTDLSKMFPGYKYEFGKSTYRGEETGEGGYVYAEPGIYKNVALLDIASMHPTSIEQLNLFGDRYTKNFSAIKQARILIKHKDFEGARKLFDGKLAPYLEDEDDAKQLSNALKIAINSVYGLTAAGFDNPFRDKRNVDNIVAKRGALFMIDLKHAVQERGYTVAHIKTDSIKIPDADERIINFVNEFGKAYGYTFEHEATYAKMALVNNAVYIAQYDNLEWTATGAQFQDPFVFKTLFTKEPIEFKDLCREKQTSTNMYLVDGDEKIFVGRNGEFCPVTEQFGRKLMRNKKNSDALDSVTGTKGYLWAQSKEIKDIYVTGLHDPIDYSYFDNLVGDACETIKSVEGPMAYDWFFDI